MVFMITTLLLCSISSQTYHLYKPNKGNDLGFFNPSLFPIHPAVQPDNELSGNTMVKTLHENFDDKMSNVKTGYKTFEVQPQNAHFFFFKQGI